MKSRFPSAHVYTSVFAVLLLGGLAAAPAAAARTFVVDVVPAPFPSCQVTPADSPTISGAVALASAGDTIVVCPNVYPESVVVDKKLTLKGPKAGIAGPDRDIFDTAGEAHVLSFTIQAPQVVLDGFTITLGLFGLPSSVGVTVTAAGYGAVVTNNVIDAIGDVASATSATGVSLALGPDNVKVTRNQIVNLTSVPSAQGILIGDSMSANPSLCIDISDNLIQNIRSSAGGAYGIQVTNGASTSSYATGYTTLTVRNNQIKDLRGATVAHAIGLEGPTPDAQVSGNKVSNIFDMLVNDSEDAVGVFFEANPYFPTVQTHLNNFDVTMSAFGIALHDALITSDGYRGSVPGTCNWWGASDGPGPVGPGSGARVTTHVRFNPFLDAPAPGGRCQDVCVSDDNDDFDHDGKRKDVDADDDNDGKLDLTDDDLDNDGILNAVDDDDDNDGIRDEDDDKYTRQRQRRDDHTVGAGGFIDSIISGDDSGLPIAVRIESPNAQFLKIEIYDPAGRLLSVSLPTPGKIFATTPSRILGLYTVRVRNTGVAPITYTSNVITSTLW